MGEYCLREDAVGDPVCELGQRVRGKGRNNDEVEALEVRVRALGGGGRASAPKVSAVTKRSAPRVRTGTMSCPALTSRRHSSAAL